MISKIAQASGIECDEERTMVRRHGWAGSPPADESEARARIIEAAMRCVDRYGPSQCSLSDVAAELGVTRQTVYRYFPGTDELFSAVGQVAVESFVDELAKHLGRITDPTDWVVEAVASTIERLPTKPHLTLLLTTGRSDRFARGFTSSDSIAVGRELLRRSSVDWLGVGYGDRELDELDELMLRIIQSMVISPPDPPRTRRELRNYLRRWIAPAVTLDARAR
jgi:AcrR family transcriptional regulator